MAGRRSQPSQREQPFPLNPFHRRSALCQRLGFRLVPIDDRLERGVVRLAGSAEFCELLPATFVSLVDPLNGMSGGSVPPALREVEFLRLTTEGVLKEAPVDEQALRIAMAHGVVDLVHFLV